MSKSRDRKKKEMAKYTANPLITAELEKAFASMQRSLAYSIFGASRPPRPDCLLAQLFYDTKYPDYEWQGGNYQIPIRFTI